MKKKKIKVKEKIIIPIYLIIIFILIFIYGNIIRIHINNSKFLKDSILILEKNQNTIFTLDKIILTSSANAIDNSEEKNLQDLSIYQFTDIAVYIGNGEELTNENTVKNLYIDNIEITTRTKKGTQSLNYKNFQNFGRSDQTNSDTPSKIEFNVVYTNEENEKANYDEPTFYTDCSNPITLGYLNSDIVTGYKMGENTSISFDGKILKAAGIELKDIECNIKFKVHLENNMQEKFSCWLNFYLPLEEVFDGTSMKSKTLQGNKYKFFCEPF